MGQDADIYRINDWALRHWRSGANIHAARTYLRRRRIDITTLPAPYRIGYARPGWTNLVDALSPALHPTAERAGLIAPTKNGRLIDRFRDRVMFPIRTLDGDIAGFIGRTVHTDPNTPKYLNTATSHTFDKSTLFYGLHEAHRAGGIHPVLVEGPLDALALAAHGPSDLLPIATSGTALTTNHALQIATWCRTYTTDPVIAYDADTAGQAATIRAGELLRNHGLHVHVTQLPDGNDPADYLTDTTDLGAFRPRPTGLATPLITAVTEEIIHRYHQRANPDWPETKLAIIRAIGAHIRTYPIDDRANVAGAASTIARIKAGIDPETILAWSNLLLPGALPAASPATDRILAQRAFVEG